MTSQQQQRPNNFSLMDILLDKLCLCGSQQEQVLDATEADNGAWRMNKYCASTPLTPEDDTSIFRHKETRPTSGRALDSIRLFVSRAVPVEDVIIGHFIEHEHEHDDDADANANANADNSIRDLSTGRELFMSPSFSSQHYPQKEYKIPSVSKYPDGPPPISHSDTNTTASLSDSMSIMTDQDEDENVNDEWLEELDDGTNTLPTEVVASECFRSHKRHETNQKNKCCPTMSTDEDEDEDEVHEAYGFLLRMKPQNYFLQEKQLEGDLDDSQYYYSNAGGVTFQLPTKSSSNGSSNGVTSLLTEPTQHTVQARTA